MSLPFSLDPTPPVSKKTSNETWILMVVLSLAVGGGGSFLANRVLGHIDQLNTRVATLEQTLQRAVDDSEAATARAEGAEQGAREATVSRKEAEATVEDALQQAATADQRAALAVERAAVAEATSLQAQGEAIRARSEAEEARRVAETEMNRLTDALGRIAETRRTALGLVMNLDEGYLKFGFDEALLRPESREVLSRIAGILFTANGFTITISGHTDTRGTARYNQKLSERRAKAVADYLISAGLAADLFTVEGLGQSQPLDLGEDDEAHAKNRRVELGIVNARIVDAENLDR